MPVPVPIDTWDDPRATWDSGLQWDVNIGPSLGQLGAWLNLVTSEHNDKPNFMAMVAATLQPFGDTIEMMRSLIDKFDLDQAVGAQLDIIGLWVGVSREIAVPIEGVYFAWGTDGVGWSQGVWRGPFDPLTGLTSLPDEAYRTLLRSRVANNAWDGTIEGAYTVWQTVFAGTGFDILIQDLGGMHMLYALTGPVPDALTRALFTGGYLNIKPAGVRIDAFLTPPIPDAPYFGWGVQNASIAGWGSGYWPVVSRGT